jgi:hypothetical protein
MAAIVKLPSGNRRLKFYTSATVSRTPSNTSWASGGCPAVTASFAFATGTDMDCRVFDHSASSAYCGGAAASKYQVIPVHFSASAASAFWG